MIDIILAIQLVCGFNFTGIDKTSCEMKIHQCYREYKMRDASDEFALKKCVRN